MVGEEREPRFNVVLYALRKDGVYGSATLRKGAYYAYHDGTEAGTAPCPALFE